VHPQQILLHGREQRVAGTWVPTTTGSELGLAGAWALDTASRRGGITNHRESPDYGSPVHR
jgi:hypothetical protein